MLIEVRTELAIKPLRLALRCMSSCALREGWLLPEKTT